MCLMHAVNVTCSHYCITCPVCVLDEYAFKMFAVYCALSLRYAQVLTLFISVTQNIKHVEHGGCSVVSQNPANSLTYLIENMAG